MFGSGNCPACKNSVGSVTIREVEGLVNGSRATSTDHCLNYCCPNCDAILGCQIDPVAIKKGTIDVLFDALRKGGSR